MSGPRVGWVLGFGSLVHPEDPLVRRLAVAGLAIPGSVAGMRRTWTAGLVNAAPEHDGKHHLAPDGTRPDLVVAALSADVVLGGAGADRGGVGAGTGGQGPGPDDRSPRVDDAAPLNVLALPVDADGLARTDARERGYERIDVSDRFEAEAETDAADRGGRPARDGGPPDGGSSGGGPSGGGPSGGGPSSGGGRPGSGSERVGAPPALDGPAWIYTATARSREDVAHAALEGRAAVSRAYVDLVEAAFRARGPAALAAYRASTDVPPHPFRDLVLHRPGVLPGE